mgnify:CR=1 FL=1
MYYDNTPATSKKAAYISPEFFFMLFLRLFLVESLWWDSIMLVTLYIEMRV